VKEFVIKELNKFLEISDSISTPFKFYEVDEVAGNKRELNAKVWLRTAPTIRGSSMLILFTCKRCGKQDGRAPWALRRCRERHGANLCRKCQDVLERKVGRK